MHTILHTDVQTKTNITIRYDDSKRSTYVMQYVPYMYVHDMYATDMFELPILLTITELKLDDHRLVTKSILAHCEIS